MLGELILQQSVELEEIARHHLPRRCRAKYDASDIVQDTALEAYRDFRLFHGNTIHDFAAWLRQISRNNAANISRSFARTGKRDIHREVSLEEHLQVVRRIRDRGPTPVSHVVLAEERLRFERALGQLPADMRLALYLRCYEQASFAEIGNRLDRSSEAARKVWCRAVKRLKLALGDQDGHS